MARERSAGGFPPESRWPADGPVAVGGDLSVERLLDAYARGIFPWPVAEGPRGLLWWSPDPRGVLDPGRLHVPRRLDRTIRSGRFTVTVDESFAEVVRGCGLSGTRRGDTWITPAIMAAYGRLHAAGVCHSVEVREEGRLVGGNLSLICATLGTPYAIDADGAVLFIEDVNEPPYRVDRMMSHLRLAGVLDKVAGIVVGQFTCKDADEQAIQREVVIEYCRPLGCPVVANFPCGHVTDNATLPLGARVALDADAGTLEVLEPTCTPPRPATGAPTAR